MNLEELFPSCGPKDVMINRIITSIEKAERRLVHLYSSLIFNLIHILIAIECLDGKCWLPKLLGGLDPWSKPPVKNKNTEEGNELWAFLPGFGFSLRDQKDRYDMLKPATAYLRSQILFNNMFVALSNVLDAYDSIHTQLGLSVSRIIRDNYSPGEVAPYLERQMLGYFTIGGCFGLIAYMSINEARSDVINHMQPTIDEYFKQTMTVEPFEKEPLKTLSVKLKPSDTMNRYILPSFAEMH
jgi:hypothetical protein